MKIDVTTLENILAELEQLHERCAQQLLRPAEIQAAFSDIGTRLASLLPMDSDLHRIYERSMREGTDWWKDTLSGYVDRSDCANVERRIVVVREILKKIEPDFLRPEHARQMQIYLQAGDVYRARQEFYRLLRRASRSIDIVDRYLDPSVFDFVDATDVSINFRLLTGDPKALFIKQLATLRGAGRSIDARSNAITLSHDRFLILDNQEVWHLGASINGLGKDACMINKVVDAEELKKVLADFSGWWSSGSVL